MKVVGPYLSPRYHFQQYILLDIYLCLYDKYMLLDVFGFAKKKKKCDYSLNKDFSTSVLWAR